MVVKMMVFVLIQVKNIITKILINEIGGIDGQGKQDYLIFSENLKILIDLIRLTIIRLSSHP